MTWGLLYVPTPPTRHQRGLAPCHRSQLLGFSQDWRKGSSLCWELGCTKKSRSKRSRLAKSCVGSPAWQQPQHRRVPGAVCVGGGVNVCVCVCWELGCAKKSRSKR